MPLGSFSLITCSQTTQEPGEEAAQVVSSGDRLQQIKYEGTLTCAGRTDLAGFGYLDDSGASAGFDIDLCKAAAAVLGDANAIEIRPISAAERGPTIQSGEVDILTRNVTWTSCREAQ